MCANVSPKISKGEVVFPLKDFDKLSMPSENWVWLCMTSSNMIHDYLLCVKDENFDDCVLQAEGHYSPSIW